MADDSLHLRGDSIVVPEIPRRVHFLYGFLAVMFAVALIRGHVGATTRSGRIVVDLVFGILLLGTIWVWVWLRRHPARLEISNDAITLTERGGKNPQQLIRSSGDLYIRRFGGRYPRPYLTTPDSDERLLLLMFDHDRVVQACVAKGWHFPT